MPKDNKVRIVHDKGSSEILEVNKKPYMRDADLVSITPAIKNLSDFSQAILKACHKIPPSKTISYNQLANLANHPNAARATGSALSKNPIPPIIPCHRIIKSTGQTGNFTAPTGKKLKQKMIDLEKI